MTCSAKEKALFMALGQEFWVPWQESLLYAYGLLASGGVDVFGKTECYTARTSDVPECRLP